MERTASKMLDLMSDVRLTNHDINYLGWQLVYQSNRVMLKRILILADSINFYNNEIQETEDGQYALF
jgi:hypothetical protein